MSNTQKRRFALQSAEDENNMIQEVPLRIIARAKEEERKIIEQKLEELENQQLRPKHNITT